MIDTATRVQMVSTLMFLEFVFAMLPGAYGVLYILGQMTHRRWLSFAGWLFAVAQLLVTGVMLRTGYLEPFWARVMVVVALVYFVMPPTLWHLAKAIHRENAPRETETETEQEALRP